MKIEDFTGNGETVEIIRNLKQDKHLKKPFSDVIDKFGHQYIDLVLEGGGVLGIALVGYTYVLEQLGFRFRGIAGTSAGAINALLLAAHKNPADAKSEHLLFWLANQDLYEFVDGPKKVKNFVDSLVKGDSKWKRVFWGVMCYDYFKDNLGLNPGEAFKKWISVILRENQAETTEKLLGKFELPNHLKIRKGTDGTTKNLETSLVMIASDITTETRVKFPEMAKLYWNRPDRVNPAEYVRASMSIPGFFFPQRVKWDGDNTGQRKKDWENEARFEGEPPREALFVDGGVVSNFPIDVFHINGVPLLPTFGVKLGTDRDQIKKVDRLGEFGLALFNTARHIHDYEFILKHPDYSQLVKEIEVGSHNWLNFSMPDKDKIDLFLRGTRAAAEFLKTFDWESYKGIRNNKAKANMVNEAQS